MNKNSNADIAKAWLRLLIDVELAKNYHQPYLLYALQTHRNPLLENLLPSLLYIKTVSILDEALTIHIEDRGLAMPSTYRNSLQGKIDFLSDLGILHNTKRLHEIREKRNALAHEISERVSWDQLDIDLIEIEKVLQHLAFVGKRPKYNFYAERSQMTKSTEPGVLFTRDFSYGLKENDRKVSEVSWTEKILAEERIKRDG